MQLVLLTDLFPEFDQLFHKIGGAQVLTIGRGVVRSCRVALGFWCDLGMILLLRPRLPLLVVDFLFSSIIISVVWWCVSVSTVAVGNLRVRRVRAGQGFASRPVPSFLFSRVAHDSNVNSSSSRINTVFPPSGSSCFISGVIQYFPNFWYSSFRIWFDPSLSGLDSRKINPKYANPVLGHRSINRAELWW
jgi:hypothetical protein